MDTCLIRGIIGFSSDNAFFLGRHLVSGASEISSFSMAMRPMHVGLGRHHQHGIHHICAMAQLAFRVVLAVLGGKGNRQHYEDKKDHNHV